MQVQVDLKSFPEAEGLDAAEHFVYNPTPVAPIGVAVLEDESEDILADPEEEARHEAALRARAERAKRGENSGDDGEDMDEDEDEIDLFRDDYIHKDDEDDDLAGASDLVSSVLNRTRPQVEDECIVRILSMRDLTARSCRGLSDEELVGMCKTVTLPFKSVQGDLVKYAQTVLSLSAPSHTPDALAAALRPALRVMSNELSRRNQDSPSAEIADAIGLLSYYNSQIDSAGLWLQKTLASTREANMPSIPGQPTDNAFYFDDESKGHNGDKVNHQQKLLFFLTEQLKQEGVRLHLESGKNVQVFARVHDAGGVFLHAYSYQCDLSDLIWTIIGRGDHELQLLCTQGRSFPSVVLDFLSFTKVIPHFKPCAFKFSYLDGVFDAHTLQFIPHDQCPDDVVCGVHIPAVFPQGALDTGVGWTALETKELDGIFKYQNLSPVSLSWFYFMLGRMLHPEDNLQLFIGLIGLPSTGKSLIAKIVQALFAPEQVGTISARAGSEQFLLATVYGKKMWVMPEPPAETDFPQSVLLSLVAMEKQYVNIKHRQQVYAYAVEGHGILVANELPRWSKTGEDSIALLRRVFPIVFRYPVSKVDTRLFDRIMETEFPTLVPKCARAYVTVKRKMGDRSFWSCCNQAFKDDREVLLRLRSSLYRFITNPAFCERGANLSIDEPTFLECYRTFLNLPKFGEHSKLGTEVGFYSILAFCGLTVVSDYAAGLRTIYGIKCA